MTATEILEVIDEVLYSAGNIPADDELDINIAIIKLLKGSGRRPVRDIEKDTKAKRCFITIRNDDLMCLPRAIVVALARLRYVKWKQNDLLRKNYDNIRKQNSKMQTEQALILLLETELPADRAGLSEDIPIYEQVTGVSICLFSAQAGNERVYNGNSRYKDKIFLYHYELNGQGHFDVLTEVNQLMCTSYYCDECGKGFKNASQHRCNKWCNICGRECTKGIEKWCENCNRMCRSITCYNEHKKTSLITRGSKKGERTISLCEQFWECPTCGITLQKNHRSPDQHECGEMKCLVCNQYHLEDNHLCYMRSRYSEKEISKFIFYDFECYQKDAIHIPNYVIAISVCDLCQDDEFNENSTCSTCGSRCFLCDKFNRKEKEFENLPCEGCGKRMVIFKGETTQKDFCRWLLLDQHTNFTVIAHNSKAYDSYFIYQHLLNSSITPDPIIFNGSKIMFMKVGRSLNMRIIDSVNFLPMPLAKFPKCFELKELKKGFFPHYFNLPENQKSVLSQLPDVHYYDPDSMSNDRREEFLKWYEEHKLNIFDFAKEIHEYCLSDVKILMEGCMNFRKLVMNITGEEILELNEEDMIFEKVIHNSVDPFSFLTIASVCMGIFRAKYLPEKWKVLTLQEHLKNAHCHHEWNCRCSWLEGRKVNATAPLEVLVDGVWTADHEVSIRKSIFVSSPIALIPPHGYNNLDNHSKQSLEWLSVVERNYEKKGCKINIQHARSKGGEKVVQYNTGKNIVRYKLDGFFQIGEKKFACEFYGCNWHGCPKCFKRDRDATVNNGKSLAQRYRETLLKEKRLKELGFELLVKWSCEFNIDLYQNIDLKAFVDELQIEDPLNIRDAYYGGRTNALCLYKKFENGEKGNYVDFCSLYPDVLKYQKYPVGHAERIMNDFKPITYINCIDETCTYKRKCQGFHKQFPYFGIVKAKFLPPRNLLHPVLPVRCNDKLKFPLCYHCASIDSKLECKCKDEERCFVQTYCTGEVDLAINMGYEIIEIYEILHWKYFDQYDVVDERGGIFTNYINAFLKIKQESSGIPDDVVNVLNYIEEYRSHEGILMIEENI